MSISYSNARSFLLPIIFVDLLSAWTLLVQHHKGYQRCKAYSHITKYL